MEYMLLKLIIMLSELAVVEGVPGKDWRRHVDKVKGAFDDVDGLS